MNKKDTLRDFILNELIRDPDYPLTDDEPIITGGLIDSFALVQVQMFISETFGVWIDDTEMTVENMDNLDDMVKRIEASKK
ncbi:MAG: acyl carrier protein [Anaerolineae bacterium]|nr:acyl carrier protein [Anaerolineae bacterium]